MSENDAALKKLLSLRHDGLTSIEIADAIGLAGSDRAKKSDILTTFKVLALAGVDVGRGRGTGKRGFDRSPRSPSRDGRIAANRKWSDQDEV